MFVLVGTFQLNLMFFGKVRSLPLSGVPENLSTWIGSGLTLIEWTRLKLVAEPIGAMLRSFPQTARPGGLNKDAKMARWS